MPTEYWYWITSRCPETGKPYLIAGGRTEEECRQRGMEMLGGLDFKIKRLPTRNLQRASSMLKGDRLSRVHSLKKAAERIGHERTVKRSVQDRMRRRGY